MPFPIEYARATEEFYAFMEAVKNEADFHSLHVTYTMVQGVLQVFRRRVSVADALMFADTLPVGLRALFVKEWDVSEVQKPFGSMAEMNRGVKQLRVDHNFSRNDAIEIVVKILPKYVETVYFKKMLAKLPDEARKFWEGGLS
jgi:uncharacterized protein (DUF2267 family)